MVDLREGPRGAAVLRCILKELLGCAAATAGTCRMALDIDLTEEDSHENFG